MDPHRHQHQLGRMDSSPTLYDQTHSRVTINIFNLQRKNGDPYGIRTHVIGVRGRCLNHLTNGPFPYFNSSGQRPEPSLTSGPTSWCTIRDSTPGLKMCHRHIFLTAFSRPAEFLPFGIQKDCAAFYIWCTIRDSNPGHPD